MDGRSFDRWSRALGLTPTRRHGIAALLGGLLAGGGVDAAGPPVRKPSTQGPCGNGSAAANRCRRNDDCCTGICNRRKRRCRCLQRGQSCTSDANCCNALTCIDGACGRPAGGDDGGGGGGNDGPTCVSCAPNEACIGGVCTACTVCASGCPYADLAAAVADGSGPTTILIAPGEYTGNSAVTRQVTIDRCGSAGTVTLKTTTPSSNVVYFQAGSSGSELRNVTVTADSSVAGVQGVAIAGVSIKIEGITVTGIGLGVYLTGSFSLDMKGSTISGCTTLGGVSAIATAPATMNLADCTISGNTTVNSNVGGGGISVANGGAQITLTGCTVSGNTSSLGNGGGVSLVGTGANAPTLTIGAGTTITGNSATGNVTGYLGYGGGVYSQEGTVTVSDPTRVSGNSATVSCNNYYNYTGSNCVIP